MAARREEFSDTPDAGSPSSISITRLTFSGKDGLSTFVFQSSIRL